MGKYLNKELKNSKLKRRRLGSQIKLTAKQDIQFNKLLNIRHKVISLITMSIVFYFKINQTKTTITQIQNKSNPPHSPLIEPNEIPIDFLNLRQKPVPSGIRQSQNS